ncbi:hypothetical protein JL721_7332 [Aureococcus anophagefferens]|nr:hypothetical protein JL721_7332 [Aureococcus anophagefferens]
MELASTPKGARAHMLQWDEIDAKIVQWAAYKLRPSRSEVPTEETKGRDYFERRIRDVRRYMQNQGPPTFLKQLQILVEQRRNRPAGYHALLAVFTSEAWREDVRDRSAPKDQALKLAAHVFMHEVLAQDRRDAAAAAANGARREEGGLAGLEARRRGRRAERLSSILTAPSPEVLAKLPARLDYDALKRSFAAATKACREVARELPGVVEGCAAHGDAASWARELGPATGRALATAAAARDLVARASKLEAMERELETTCWPALDAGWALEEASRSGEEGEVARRLLSDWFAFAAAGGDEAALPPGYGGETLRDLARASEKLAELQRVAAGVAPSPARPRNAAAASRCAARRGSSLRRREALRRGAPRRRRRLPRRRRVAEPAAAELPLAQARRGLHAAGGGARRARRLGRRARDVWVGALAGRVAARCAARERARKDRGDAETGADRLRDALRSWRDVLCGGSGALAKLGVAVDALCGPDLADAAVLVDGVAARLCDDGALGLRARVFAVLAAADYDDAEDRRRGEATRATCSRASRRAATSTPSRRRRATADAHFAALREGVAVFKLDPESLKYLVLQPDGPLAGLDRAAVVDVLSRRTDAWTYRGRRAAWVDELAASF